MGIKRWGGYVFITYTGDHRPYHVHIKRGRREIGRWDIENQKPMDAFEVSERLMKALVRLGYADGDTK